MPQLPDHSILDSKTFVTVFTVIPQHTKYSYSDVYDYVIICVYLLTLNYDRTLKATQHYEHDANNDRGVPFR